jgi:hypothetical protein
MTKKSKKPAASQKDSFIATIFPYLFCFIIIVLRFQTHLFRAEFWAEDATEFFKTAMALGVKSLITPLMGYHFFIGRIVAWLATFLPVLWVPFFYAWVTVFVGAFVSGYFSRDGFAWLVPSRYLRWLVCTALVIGPGTAEIFGNLINMSTALAMLFVLLLLEKPFEMRRGRFLVLLLLMFSSGQIVAFTPLMFYLWYRTRNPRYLWLLGAFVPVFVLNSIGSTEASAKVGYFALESLQVAPRAVVENFFLRFFINPWLGGVWTGEFQVTPAWVFWPTCLTVSGVFFWKSFQRGVVRTEEYRILSLTYLCTIALFGLIALMRKYAVGQVVRESGWALWEMRYSYLPGAIVLIGWFTLLFRWAPQRLLGRAVLVAALVILFAHNIAQWERLYPRPDKNWPAAAHVIQEALDQKARGQLSQPLTFSGIGLHPPFFESGQFSITIQP